MRLEELVEALLVRPGRDPPFNSEDCFSDPHDILQIIPGLISLSPGEDPEHEEIRLAHASVKDYLTSGRICQGETSCFSFSVTSAHQFLTESCLLYILRYDQAPNRTGSPEDLNIFPLLDYACKFWHVHKRAFSTEEQTPTNRQACSDALLIRLLISDSKTLDWLQVHRPDITWRKPFDTDYDLGSSLYYAACIGFREGVRMLLDKGVDVNTEGGFYGSPLRAAARYGHKMTCLLLLQRGAELEDTDPSSNCTALWFASDAGHETVVQLFLESGADIEAGSDQGTGTAVYAAASNRHLGVVRLLLEQGANVNAETPYKKTALRGAAMNGDLSMINLLLENKADIETRDMEGQTPLIRAAVGGKDAAVMLLLDRGANIEAKDNKGQSGLSWAARHGQIATLKLLLERGADVESKDHGGQTALHKAATSGNNLAVSLLLEHGAHPSVEDASWLTPSDWAQRHGNFNIVRMLAVVEAAAQI